jgi:uncharacterized protein YfaS (alpha-2-macroglobulin family)
MFLSTDKEIYRNLDVMFIEGLVFDAFEKTPIFPEIGDEVLITFHLFDPNDQQVYEWTDNAVIDSTVTFTYKVPIDAPGGQYTITLSGNGI